MSDAETTVRAFLAALEARDLDAARALTGPGFAMRFPGTGPMTDLSQLLDWAAGRYRRVGKTVEAVETLGDVVYLRGTLHGDWPDGSAFDGIRFIDRFELRGGKIVDQQDWNDLADARAKAPA